MLQAAGVGAAGVAAAGLVGCGDDDGGPAQSSASPGSQATAAVTPKRGGIYRAPAPSSPPSLDLFRASNNLEANSAGGAVMSRLFARIADSPEEYSSYRVEPDVIASYESPDPLTLTMKMRNNVKFHAPISRLMTADDVVFSWERFNGRTPGVMPALALTNLNMIDSLRAIDANTVQIKVKSPYAPLLVRLADHTYLSIFPKEAGTAYDPATKLVGSGPWMFNELTQNISIKLRRNPEWHLDPQRPYMDGHEQYVVPEYATQLTQFMAGNLDAGPRTLLPDDAIRILQQVKGANVWTRNDPFIDVFTFSDEPNAPWRDPRVRHAVSMGIDRAAIADVLYEPKKLESAGIKVEIRPHNMLASGLRGYWLDPEKADPKVRPFLKYDPDGAKKLLAEAGFANGFSAPFHYPSAQIFGPATTQNAELMGQMLGRIGIRVNAVVEDGPTFTSKTFLGQFDGFAYLGLGGNPYPEFQLELRYLPGPQNTSKVNDPEITTRVQAILAELNVEKRKQLVLDIQNLLADKMYYVSGAGSSGPRLQAAQPYVRNGGQYLDQRSTGTMIEDTYIWLDK